jgi:mannose-6-phosphate isomerase-like protein (cupin superfamily)
VAEAKINMPGEGRSVWLVGDLITVKVSSEETGGAYSLLEETTPPEGGPPPHLHANEDETLYVLEGEVDFLVGDQITRAGAGSSAYLPRGVLHTFKNVGRRPARSSRSSAPEVWRGSSWRPEKRRRKGPPRPRGSRTWTGLWR